MDLRQYYSKGLTLQTKFIFVTSIAVIVLMVVLWFIITKHNGIILHKDIESQGRLLAETISKPILNDLLNNRNELVGDRGLFTDYVTSIFRRNHLDLIYITVTDKDGKVRAHNNSLDFNMNYSESEPAKIRASSFSSVRRYINNKNSNAALNFTMPLISGTDKYGELNFAISLVRVEKAVELTIKNIMALAFLLLIIGFVIIYVLSMRFINPITELAKMMEKESGETLDIAIDVKGTDEIALLYGSFNSLIGRIKESNIEIKNTHEKLLDFIQTIEKTGGDMLNAKVDIKGSDEIELLCQSYNSLIDRIWNSNLELKKTHEKLFQSQNLASIGILAAGVAHEINNPIGGMFNCVQILERKGENKEFRQRYLKLFSDGLNRIENTVEKLLWMSRKEKKRPQAVSIKQSIDDIYGFVEYKLKKSNINYVETIEDNTFAMIDPHDLQQILINLLFNAIYSMDKGGTLGINAYRSNSKVIVEVSDTGTGISAEDRTMIFDPFYTTKKPGEGTGLGLWLTYEILKNYKNEILVDSTVGKGSTFTIKLRGA